MSLFARLRSKSPERKDDVARALLAPAVMTMIIDGSINDAEREQLKNVCLFNPIFLKAGAPYVVSTIQDLIAQLTGTAGTPEQIMQSLLQEINQTLPMPLRETAFCFAARIALADGHVDDNEMRMLEVLAQRMELNAETANKILDVVVIMQRGEQA